MQKLFAVLIAAHLILASTHAAQPDEGFSFKDTPGQFLDILYQGKIVGRYMDGHDVSTPEKRLDTFKPYLHIYDAQGTAPITKGPGGTFPHHRGIFIGYDKLIVGGKSYDRWHMIGGDQIHQKFLAQEAGPESARFTALIDWTGEEGKGNVLEEERTITFLPPPAPGYAFVDFSSKLKAVAGETQLDGEAEHAGIHFRPVEEIERTGTVYVFPKKGANAHKDTDYPWVGETFTLNGKRYSVIYFNHPSNPKKTLFSAYRDYGRFGAFYRTTIPANGELTLHCRFLIAEGEMLPVETIQKIYNVFAGTSDPVPETAVNKGEAMATPAPQPPSDKTK